MYFPVPLKEDEIQTLKTPGPASGWDDQWGQLGLWFQFCVTLGHSE